jgi:hypothetical protein
MSKAQLHHKPTGPVRARSTAKSDYLHFSMQLDGVQIDPKGWCDSHWIKDHIAKRVDLLGFK